MRKERFAAVELNRRRGRGASYGGVVAGPDDATDSQAAGCDEEGRLTACAAEVQLRMRRARFQGPLAERVQRAGGSRDHPWQVERLSLEHR